MTRTCDSNVFSMLVEELDEYAVFTLGPDGHVETWNAGAERLWGESEEQIRGQHLSRFFVPLDVAQGQPDEELRRAATIGRSEHEGARLRHDGSPFVGNLVTKALRDRTGALYGFAVLTRDVTSRRMTDVALQESENRFRALMDNSTAKHERAKQEIEKLNAELEQRVSTRTAELERTNEELRAFSYSVSHDLRAPLRAIDGFSQALMDDFADRLDAVGLDFLKRVRTEAQRMGQLMDDLLELFRVSRTELRRSPVNLSEIARQVGGELTRHQPDRRVQFVVQDRLIAEGDERLLRVVLENLLANAWKFTAPRDQARIEFGAEIAPGQPVWFIRDNGVGFDMAYADRLFSAFQRLHSDSEFSGTGIGLATVQRIVYRHGGRIWVEASVDKGATFFFTLG